MLFCLIDKGGHSPRITGILLVIWTSIRICFVIFSMPCVLEFGGRVILVACDRWQVGDILPLLYKCLAR